MESHGALGSSEGPDKETAQLRRWWLVLLRQLTLNREVAGKVPSKPILFKALEAKTDKNLLVWGEPLPHC